MRIRNLIPVLSLAAAALAAPAAASAAVTAPPAAVTAPAGYGTGIIFGACSPLLDGRYKLIWYGGYEYLAECIHLPWGWRWVEDNNACPGAVPALAARPAGRC